MRDEPIIPGNRVILPDRECRICREQFKPTVPLQRICPNAECKRKNRRVHEMSSYAKRKGRERAA